MHRFQLALLAGQAPDKPEAWVRTVARRSACALLRNGWARMQPIGDDALVVADRDADPTRRYVDSLRNVCSHALTRRQHQVLEAALTCRTTRDAARTAAMEPRDFRRYLVAITRRARRELARAARGSAAASG